MSDFLVAHWQWFIASFITPNRDDVIALSNIVIALFTVVLAWVGWRQVKITRILQRAYLNAEFGGIGTSTAGEILGYVIFQNVGHLPAKKFYWVVNIETGNKDWLPTKVRNKDLVGESIVPAGAKWPKGSAGLAHPQSDPKGLYVYVWGKAKYKDGFRWRKRQLSFCHRYP